ncbi:hypothetical protein IAR55_007127 [Kwoniella newhampshirensis]|uniref:Uncharacterized protein n=1 Tax=Kwoniella newhampshirensis TaxID=1651941 RepID=A0AAW0YTG3_9TREE
MGVPHSKEASINNPGPSKPHQTNPKLRPRAFHPKPHKTNLPPHVTKDFSILERFRPPGYTAEDRTGGDIAGSSWKVGADNGLQSDKLRRQLEEMQRMIMECRRERSSQMIVARRKDDADDELPRYEVVESSDMKGGR